MWLIVTDPPSHAAHDGVPVIAFDPAEAAPQVTALRTPPTEPVHGDVVPAAPGSAVCSPTYDPAGAVNAVPPSMSSHLLASVVAAMPVVILAPHSSLRLRTGAGSRSRTGSCPSGPARA